jgi:hypothetical protein
MGDFGNPEGVLIAIYELTSDCFSREIAAGSKGFRERFTLLIEEIAERLRNSMPKMYSLYSEASMLPRKSSHARKRRAESWLRVSLVIPIAF